MTENKNYSTINEISFRRKSQFKETWRRLKKNKLAMFALILLVLIILLIISAPLFGSYKDSLSINLKEKLQPPSANHIFGTDKFGRDVFLRILHGGKFSIIIGLSTSLFSMILGIIFGTTAGYFGGKIDNVIMRFMDVFAAIPTIMLAMAIVAALGPSITNLIIALAISRVQGFTRIVRSSAITIADQEFVEAAKAGGSGHFRILLKHILPNCVAPIAVQATMNVSLMISLIASLSFLGLGITPPNPEWGTLIAESKPYIRYAPYLIFFPGLFLVLTSMSVSLLGDGLRDALDPRLKS